MTSIDSWQLVYYLKYNLVQDIDSDIMPYDGSEMRVAILYIEDKYYRVHYNVYHISDCKSQSLCPHVDYDESFECDGCDFNIEYYTIGTESDDVYILEQVVPYHKMITEYIPVNGAIAMVKREADYEKCNKMKAISESIIAIMCRVNTLDSFEDKEQCLGSLNYAEEIISDEIVWLQSMSEES